jgi:hypothetical protein
MNYNNALDLAKTLGVLNASAVVAVAKAAAAGDPSPLRSYESPEGLVVEWPTRPLPLVACWAGPRGQAKLRSLARRLRARPY